MQLGIQKVELHLLSTECMLPQQRLAVGLSLGSIVKQSNMNATASGVIVLLTSSGIGGA